MYRQVWKSAIADFRFYLRLERALSLNTISSYISDINKLAAFSEDISPYSMTSERINSFLIFEIEHSISKRSQARVISSIKSFYKYLETEGRVSSNPCDLVDSPKLTLSLPEVLSVEEIESILSSVDLSKDEGCRNRAILEVLYSCGLRVSELVNMKISDLFFDDSFVRIIGKGDKQRLVPIGDPALKAVKNYLASSKRLYSGATDDVLFLNRRGKKLTREMIFMIVRDQAMIAGVKKVVSPHTFRHSFASHLVENGADLRVVQEMLGHESILTTEIYTHIDTKKWQQKILQYHPRG